MKISICCVEHKMRPDLDKFLRDIPGCTHNDYEVIVSDNSPDGSVSDHISQNFPGLPNKVLIPNKANLGLGKGMNIAMRAAKGEYILRTDTDIDIFPGWDQKLVDIYEQYPQDNIGIVGTYNQGHGNQMDRGGWIESDILITYCMLIPRKTIEHMNNFYSLTENDGKTPTGRYLNVGGGYADPNYIYGFEDFDYSLAARWSGKRLAMIKKVVAIHKEASNQQGWDSEWRHKTVWQMAEYFRAKWSRLCNFWDVDKTYNLNTKKNGWLTLWGCIPINVEYVRDMLRQLSAEKKMAQYRAVIDMLKNSNDWPIFENMEEAKYYK